MRLCLPARMGGGGKAESLPWSGPAGKARHTGVTILLWEREGKVLGVPANQETGLVRLPSRHAAYKWHPRMARRRRMPCWRTKADTGVARSVQLLPWPRKRETSGHLTRREARVPAGQPKDSAPSGARSAGKSVSSEIPAHLPTLLIVTRRAKTTGLVRDSG